MREYGYLAAFPLFMQIYDERGISLSLNFKQYYNEIIFDANRSINILYNATQGDTKSRGFYVTITQNGVVIPVTTETMTLYAQKPDGKRVLVNAVKDDNKFRIDLTNQVFAVPGEVKCELTLRGTNGESITSKTFLILVEEKMPDGSIISEDERGIIDIILAEGANMLAKEEERVLAEEIRVSNENNRISNENTRISEENIRLSNETDRVESELVRKSSEIERVNAEELRISAENQRVIDETIRQSAEGIRQSQEQDRQTNTANAINNINNTNDAFKVWEDYDNLKDYVPLNKVQYQGSSYVNKIACKGILPTDTNNWQLVALKGADGLDAGDMKKSEYDANNNGKVDLAEDAEKLGGQLPIYYAKQSDMDNKVDNSRVLTDVPLNAKFTDTITPIANNLTETVAGKALDATQGKVLDDRIGILNGKVSPETPLNTTSQNLSGAVNEVKSDLDEHKADFMSHGIDNAGFHSSIFRGNNLGNTVTTEQYTAISSGTFTDLYIGDYWTIGGINWRIAAFNYYRNTGDSLVSGNHITLVPDTPLYDHVMNDTNTTTGGYIGSKMYLEGLEQAKTTIRGIFGTHLVKHRQIHSNATVDGKASGWAWVDSEVDLMSEIMVYGSTVWGESTIGGTGYNIGVGKSQLPLFALNPQSITINTRQHYWLRDVVSASNFALVSLSGNASTNGASNADGVRPAFSIS